MDGFSENWSKEGRRTNFSTKAFNLSEDNFCCYLNRYFGQKKSSFIGIT